MHPFLIAAFILAATTAPKPPGATPGPTMAVEDTMHTEVPEVLVKAPRVTLDEIIDRVARGEARRDSMLQDQAFTITFRVVTETAPGGKPPEPLVEKVIRVYKKRPDRLRTVTLREWYRWQNKDKDNEDMNVEFRSRMDEEMVNFAFRPENRRDFRFRIVGRDLLGNRLIYRISFNPKSALDPTMPKGLVWVDTNEFVIVRQELGFERSPIPLFLKGIDRMVLERERVDGYWVLKRVMMRAEMSIPIPKFGRSFDFGLLYDKYAINEGIADSLFDVRGGRQ